MFTIRQIDLAHEKVKSGEDFPKYIQELKALGVVEFETWVFDSHTNYFGANHFQTSSGPKYEPLAVADKSNPEQFTLFLKMHQQGQTDYLTFCRQCAETGVEKWIMDLKEMTCTYSDKAGIEILKERVPST